MYRRSRSPRKWRLRGRRGQVAAVATILGLLLIVVYIANYLTTTLPGQMSVNDLNHVIQVEDQVGHLQALLESASADNAVGAELTQPITLGSQGTPPFAAPDSGSVGPATNGSYFQLNSTLSGPPVYTPPTGGTANTGRDTPTGGCPIVGTTMTCTGTNHLIWNFSGSAVAYSLVTTAGTYLINVTDSGASSATPAAIAVTPSASNPIDVTVIGNNDTVTLTLPVTATYANVVIYGNYDSLIVLVTGAGATDQVHLLELGLHDTTTLSGAAGLTFLASIFGSTNSVAGPTTANSNAGTKVGVYFSGFTTGTTACPADTLASSDSVSGSSTTGTYFAEYNVTTPFTPTAVADWTQSAQVVTPVTSACPFFTASTIPFHLAQSSAGFDVHFRNTYMPSGDVAFDQGGVVYAQTGGVPVMLDPPSISATAANGNFTSFSVWFPVFVGTLPTDSGLSSATFATRLASVNTIALSPSTSIGIANATSIVLTIHSPFAAAWAGYFNSTYPFQNHWACLPAGSVACLGPYSTGGAFGTVVLTIPTGYLLDALTIQLATFNVSIV